MSDQRASDSGAVTAAGGARRGTAMASLDDVVLQHFCQGASAKEATVSDDARLEVRNAVAGQGVPERWWRVAGPRALVLVRLAGRLAAGYAALDDSHVIEASHAKDALEEAGIAGLGLWRQRQR